MEGFPSHLSSLQVAKQEEFFNLSHCQLATLISRDDLNVRCESEVFHACIDWVKYDCPQRRFYVQALLRAVRCHALTPRFLQTQLQKCEIDPEINEPGNSRRQSHHRVY